MKGERFSGIRRIFHFRSVEPDLNDELAFHFECTVEELMAEGRSRAQAEEEAGRRFGDQGSWRRELERIDRRMQALHRRGEHLARVGGDVRYAFRRMRRSPGLTAGVVLTFALGIGANATMFGIVDRLLLRPPAHVAEPDAVKRLLINGRNRFTGTRITSGALTYPMYRDFTRAESFSSVAAFAGRTLTAGHGESAEQLNGMLATGEFFSLLGAKPVLGRFFGPEEDRPEAPGVAVVSHRYWQRQFGGERSVLGDMIDFGYGPYRIVGVAPRGFTGVDLGPVDVWVPLRPAATAMQGDQWATGRGYYWLNVVARLAPAATPKSAQAEATALHLQGQQELIDVDDYDPDAEVIVAPLIAARGPLAPGESVVAKWLAGVSLFVLLIACANVANLLLARSIRQRRETGIRLALGVSRSRLLTQALTESLVLALLGGATALLITRWVGGMLGSILLPNVAWGDPVGEVRVMFFGLAAALLAGVVSGIIPAFQSSRPDVIGVLKSGARTATAPGAKTRSVLTTLQAALSVVLLVGAGLFVRSLHRVQSLDLGIELDGVVLARPIYDGEPTMEEEYTFYGQAVERLAALPAVEHATTSVGLPFRMSFGLELALPGLDSIPRVGNGYPSIFGVDRNYFHTLGLRILRGRAFESGDVLGTPRVVVVNETMARVLWPGQDALGKCLIIGERDQSVATDSEARCAEVVGVVEDAHQSGYLEEARSQYYVPLAQRVVEQAPGDLVLRTAGDPTALIPAIRRELFALDPRIRFVEVQPLADELASQRRAWELGATMFTIFGLLALVVAGVGLYSVLAFGVIQRVPELSIRSALGASPGRLVRLVLGHGMRLVLIGVAVGLAVAILVAPRIEELLFQVSARDPLTLSTAAAVLLLVGVFACAVPAWRSTRAEPSTALRAE